jgi:hypothetical protein
MQTIPYQWRFRYEDEEISLRDLSWSDVARVLQDAEAGNVSGQADGVCVSLEFDRDHAAVLYMGRDGVILRPYFPHLPPAVQDLGPFFCDGCGVRLGAHGEYLARFMSRADGFRLFAAVLAGPSLPSRLPDPHAGQPALPGLEGVIETLAAGRVLEWRPLSPVGEDKCGRKSN